jgi:thiamine biosynthesis protein ThiS
MSALIRAVVNGQPTSWPPETTLGAIVESYGLPKAGVLVECNGEALWRSEWPQRGVQEGDVVELIRVAAGG